MSLGYRLLFALEVVATAVVWFWLFTSYPRLSTLLGTLAAGIAIIALHIPLFRHLSSHRVETAEAAVVAFVALVFGFIADTEWAGSLSWSLRSQIDLLVGLGSVLFFYLEVPIRAHGADSP